LTQLRFGGGYHVGERNAGLPLGGSEVAEQIVGLDAEGGQRVGDIDCHSATVLGLTGRKQFF